MVAWGEESIPAFAYDDWSITTGVGSAQAIERLVRFLDGHQTDVVFLRLSGLQEDVARIRPIQGRGPITSIRFKRACYLARHSRIHPDKGWSDCVRVTLRIVRSGALDLGTVRWLTIATAHVEGYFRVGENLSGMGWNTIQVQPVVKPGS